MTIRNIFNKIIDNEYININKGIYVEVETFEGIFHGAETYDDFIAIDNGEKGYKVFFDECKRQGILN